MAVTHEDGTVKAEDLAEFLWGVEYDTEAYRWATLAEDEKNHYRYVARQLVNKFEISPR